MKSWVSWAGVVACLFLAIGCGGDDGGGGGSACESGCELTITADCDNGPTSQGMCVADCERLQNDPTCGAEYTALLNCNSGGSVSCDGQGIPVVDGCEAQQTAFINCLSQ